MVTVNLSNGLKFRSEGTEILLDSAERANVALAYSCRTGRCSSCKCKVISGDSEAIHPEIGLTEPERAAGWILSCVRTPTSDMELEVEDLGGIILPKVKTLPCRIQTIEKLAPDVIKVIVRLPPSVEFSFLPGQYVNMIGQGGLRRSYSLASGNAADNLLELQIRATPNGQMSDYWFSQAKVNDLLRLNGPLGTFFLRNLRGLELILLATGTGIAPVKSMLESIEMMPEESRPRSISLYWGGRKPADLYWDVPTFGGILRYVPVLSRAGGDWTGARGYVQDALLADVQDFSAAVVYACGSDDMIKSAHGKLVSAGLPEQRFLSDAFVCSAST